MYSEQTYKLCKVGVKWADDDVVVVVVAVALVSLVSLLVFM